MTTKAQQKFVDRAAKDYDEAVILRKTVKTMKSPVKFKTHPNAPVVVNRFVVVGGKRIHNSDPYRAKYSSVANAEWMRDTMNKDADSKEVWYIATA